MPKLSICIPTYNRSRYLAELLDSIVAQNLSEIEVVVSDDGSVDDTAAVVARYQAILKHLKFIQQPVNIGLDRNFIEVTRAATGDYLWLMGDDDRLEPGGALRVLGALERWPNVVGLTLGVIDYDPLLQRATGVRGMPGTQLITGAAAVFSTVPELLGFMSAMVINRRDWELASKHTVVKSMNNLYSQVYIVGVALGKLGKWGVVNEKCVGFRSDNDQFKRKLGWFERMKVDVKAYDEIADLLFGENLTTHRIMRARIFESHVIARLINSKTETGPAASRIIVAAYLLRRYASIPQLWTKGLPILFAPKVAVQALRKAYKRFSKSSGSARARQIKAR